MLLLKLFPGFHIDQKWCSVDNNCDLVKIRYGVVLQGKNLNEQVFRQCFTCE